MEGCCCCDFATEVLEALRRRGRECSGGGCRWRREMAGFAAVCGPRGG